MNIIANMDQLPGHFEDEIEEGPISIDHTYTFKQRIGRSYSRDGRDAVTDKVLRDLETLALQLGYDHLKRLVRDRGFNALFNVHLIGGPRIINTKTIYDSTTSYKPVDATVEARIEGLIYRLNL